MNFFRRTKGSVSIFLVLILVPIIVVCTIFVDVSRIRLADGLVTSSAELALNSVMTQYDMELADYYGLMASCQDIESFYDVAEDYFAFCMISQGISAYDAQKWSASLGELLKGETTMDDLLQIDTENTEAIIGPVLNANLANPAMVKEEIIEFMKYRAPLELIGEGDTKNGFIGKLESVKEEIEMLPHETRIQKEKVEYYNAENELLKEALIIYEILKTYENIKYDGTNYLDDAYLEQIQKDIKSGSDTDMGLEEYYKELHKKYVTYWANTEEYTTAFVSVETHIAQKGHKTISGKKSSSAISDEIKNCENKRKEYEAAKAKMQEKLNSISFAKPDPSRTLNEVQYWVQMEKAMGTTYKDYINALVAFRQAMLNMKHAHGNKEDGWKTKDVPVYDNNGNPDLDPITKQQIYKEEKYKYDIGTDPYKYDTSVNVNSAYSTENSLADSAWQGYTNDEIYGISKNLQTYSTNALNAKLTDRVTAEAEITAAYTDLKAAHELITGAQETLQQIVDRIPKLIELVNKYNAAFETWSGDVDTHKNKGSDLIDSDHQEIQVIKGEISEDAVDISTEGLVRVDIKETDVENFKTRLQNTIDLLQSYRETIESVRYRGTTIIGEDVVEKPLTGDTGINTFDRFEKAATSQKNGCTAPVVEKAKISVYHDSKGEEKGIDAYIEETWEITDGLDTLVATTHDNSPKLHDYDHWKDTASPDIDSFDAWLHNKFDLIEIASDKLDGVMSRLKDMIKGFADSALADFGTYTNPYLSAKKYADIANLPSNGASDPIKEDTAGNDVSKDEDDVTKDLDSSSSVSGLFDNLSFEFHMEDVRDKLYTMEYVMRMFTYETQALEYVYNQAREGMPEDDIYQVKKSDGTTMDITPGNAENLYKPYLDEGGVWWTDEEKTLTYNKSMTNKLFNYENNYSFGNEVEYIMFGGDIDSSKTKIGATLYFIRYALNLTPVMAKYWPQPTVTNIATTISSATAGVIPIPLIKAVICLGICAAEAAVDVNYLKAGLPVLFIKGKDELFILLELDETTFPDAVKNGASYGGKAFSKNSVKIGKKSSDSDSSAGLTFSYSDYLRIFLYIQLTASEDNAYLRIADVIQANMTSNVNLTEHVDNFEMSKAITYFNIDATVRVKPLMLTLPYAKNYGSDTVLNTDAWNTIRKKMTRGY